jgi:hypothetical protein
MTKNIINGGRFDTIDQTKIMTHKSTESIPLKLQISTSSLPKRRLLNTNKSLPNISNHNLFNKYSSKHKSLPINLKQILILKEKLKNLSSMNVKEQIQILKESLKNLSSMNVEEQILILKESLKKPIIYEC